jgi:NADP-dependent 3-hydroxy acid dehydrogenase YdfG
VAGHTTAQEFTRATQVTYPSTVYGTMAAPEQMVPRDHRTVVQAGSALACRAIPPQAAYCGAKSAIGGFTGSARTELMASQSRAWITMVQIPGVNTPQFNWCRSRPPEASALPFLLPASGPGVATHPSPALKLRQEPPA